MNFSDIFKKSFVSMFSQTNLSTSHIIMTLCMTCVIALYIFAVYRLITRKTFYNKNFNISLTALSIITAIVILTVQANIVISLGMVGALSIVRFRTAIKDPMDLVFLFWSISIGIACGAGMMEIAIVGSVLLTIVIFILDRLPVAKAASILVINASSGLELMSSIHEIVKQNCKYYKIKSRNASDTSLDVVIELWTSNEDTLLKELQALKNITTVSLMSHDGEVTF